MAFRSIDKSDTSGTILFEGKLAKVIKESSAYLTIEVDGKKISVPKKSPLFDFSHLIESNEKLISSLEEQAEYYSEQVKIETKNKRSIIDKIGRMFKEWGVRFRHQMDPSQVAQYDAAKDSYYTAAFARTSASNRCHGLYSSILDLKLDNANYNNMLA